MYRWLNSPSYILDFTNGLFRSKKVYKNLLMTIFSKRLNNKKGHSAHRCNLTKNWNLTTPKVYREIPPSHLQFDMYTSMQNIG